jgi:hypothetical protein
VIDPFPARFKLDMLRIHLAILLANAVAISGCSGRVATYPVSGTVRFDDRQPVRVGIIEFRCPETGVSARAKLDDRGAFQLGTFAEADGAPAGDYRVVVVQYFNALPTKHAHTRDDHNDHEPDGHDARDQTQEPDARVARKFSDYSTFMLTAKVRPDADNQFEFVVTHPKEPIRRINH